jgi:hypothetical protein
MDMTLNIYFTNGFHGTLTHDDPQQIRKWFSIFCQPEAMDYCGIASLSIDIAQNGLQEAA